MATISSSHQALNIAELLELILLELDMHTLLHCQRVTKFWQSSIKQSKTLQQKLWLLPDDRKDEKPLAKINPLILKYHKRLGISNICGQSIDDTQDVYAFKVPYNLDHGYSGYGDLLYISCSHTAPSPGSWQHMIIMTSTNPSKSVAWSFCTIGSNNLMWVSCGIFATIGRCEAYDYGRDGRSAVLSSGDRIVTLGQVLRKEFGRLIREHQYPAFRHTFDRQLQLCGQDDTKD